MGTKPCSAPARRGRLEKARQFIEAAELMEASSESDDLLDAQITLCVHAGIAAADVVCCARLGEYATGQNHAEAIQLLASVDKPLSKDLSKLLGMKTRAGYSSNPSSTATAKTAMRSATRLVTAAAAL